MIVSIALAAYNGGTYIRKQVDSILNQTFHDFELVACDDCSTDATVKILNEYARKDNWIKLFVNERKFRFKKNFDYDEYLRTARAHYFDYWDNM